MSERAPAADSTVAAAPLLVAPAQVLRGEGALARAGEAIAPLGQRPLVVAGETALAAASPALPESLQQQGLAWQQADYRPDSSQTSLAALQQRASQHGADCIVGVGGGKALDAAKLLAQRRQLPVVTVPTSAATCAAWTALANVYTDRGAFRYDVPLERCPNGVVLDYAAIRTAPQRTLVAGIGDALAKWYEASVSGGEATDTLTVAAVQQARVLRDILLQKASAALEAPGSQAWQDTVDATVLLAGAVGGLGGARCRTVAAHAVHNGLTHLPAARGSLHGEKVAYGILVQLRLEETVRSDGLAASARQQLLPFYGDMGLPRSLEELGLAQVPLRELRRAAAIACRPDSSLHELPFAVTPEQLTAAMVSTAPTEECDAPASLPEFGVAP